MNIKYRSLNNLNKSLSTDSSFLVKTTYSTKSSTSNLLSFPKPKQPISKPTPSTTTHYLKRNYSPQYNTILPTPRFIQPNLTPAQRKLHEQGNSISPNLNYSNSLGYIDRLSKTKQETSMIFNDKVSNKSNADLIKAKEKQSKGYRNLSKDKKIDAMCSDIFNKVFHSSNVIRTKLQDNEMYKKVEVNKGKKKRNRTPGIQQCSRLAMEVERKYGDKETKIKKYLNLTSQMDNYSMFSPGKIKVVSYDIKSMNPRNDVVHIKKMFANGGIHVYDVKDNTKGLNKQDSLYNVKVRIDPENKISQKTIDSIKKKLMSNNALMKINKNLW